MNTIAHYKNLDFNPQKRQAFKIKLRPEAINCNSKNLNLINSTPLATKKLRVKKLIFRENLGEEQPPSNHIEVRSEEPIVTLETLQELNTFKVKALKWKIRCQILKKEK